MQPYNNERDPNLPENQNADSVTSEHPRNQDERLTQPTPITPDAATPQSDMTPAAPASPYTTPTYDATEPQSAADLAQADVAPTTPGATYAPPFAGYGPTPTAGYGTNVPYGVPPTVNYAQPMQQTPAWQKLNWRQAVIALVIVVVLITGVGIGVIVNHGSAKGTTATGSSPLTTTSATVTLPSTVQDLQQTVISVVNKVQPSVVEIESSNRNGTATGSGEFLTKDGYIVTNDHVVTGYTSFKVTLFDGSTQTATIVGEDAQDDLAVIKVNVTNATPITIADSSQAQIGQFVIAIGSPLGLEQSATFGIVSALNRTEQESSSGNGFSSTSGPVLTGLIQTSAPINPGNSGGALVDLNGRLIGIPTLGASSTSSGETVSGIGFAIPANRVSTIATQLIQNGKVSTTGQGFLGIQGQDVDASVAQSNSLSVTSGVLIGGFANDTSGSSPAQSAGVQSGDVIVAINGTTVNDSLDLAGVIQTLSPGTKVQLSIVRGTSKQTISVTLGERPLS